MQDLVEETWLTGMAVGAGAEGEDVEILTTEAEEEILGGRIMIEMVQVMTMAWGVKLLGQGGNNASCKCCTIAYTMR